MDGRGGCYISQNIYPNLYLVAEGKKEGNTGMDIRQATLEDLLLVKKITETTILEIYPHYYPKGAVKFFLAHHSETNIANDIMQNRVFLCYDTKHTFIGTVTIKKNPPFPMTGICIFAKTMINN